MTLQEVDPSPSYTIDELAAVSRVPSRTIRFYQSRGLLKSPQIRGRAAVYGESHLERLKRIAQLQDRGLRIDTIRTLIDNIDRGELDLGEWLGIEQAIQKPWTDDHARTVTEAELYTLAGTDRPGLLADLTRARLIERHGDVFLLESPGLFSAALKLEAAGVDLGTAVAAWAVLQKHMSALTRELVELFMRRTTSEAGSARDPVALFEALRPSGLEAVRIVFSREVEGALRKLVATGRLRSLPGKSRRARPEPRSEE